MKKLGTESWGYKNINEMFLFDSCNSSISKIKSDLLDLKGCCQGPKKANINQVIFYDNNF